MSPSSTADREVVVSRLIDAPRDLVFKLWTHPDHVGEWWGPNGFTTSTHEIEVRVGGIWRFVMHGPDGTDYRNRIVYREIVEPERIVYDHSDDSPDDTLRFQTTVTFEDRGGKTELTLRALFDTAAVRDHVVRKSGAEEGGKQTLGRLAAYAENAVILTGDEVIIARTFDAPPEFVFACWTEPEHFQRWWGPEGFETPSCSIDASPGGVAHFNMRSSQFGMDMWYGRLHQEVTPPERLVFTEYLADADGNKKSPADFGMGGWPGEMLISVDFTEHEGGTTMVMRAQLPASVQGREHALGGWSQAFDKLASHLSERGA